MESPPSWEVMYGDEKYCWFWPPAYDPGFSPPDLEAVVSFLEAQPGARLLDLACGQGWLTIPLAQRGFQISGFDLSAALLARAEQAAAQAGVQIEWVRGDMRHLPDRWSGGFEAVTFTLSEFGCFHDESDNQRVLDEVARVLKPDGRFVLDIVVNRDGAVQRGETHDYLEGDGFIVAEKASFDLLTGMQKRVYRWYHQGQRHEAEWQIRTYTPPEVVRMLERGGLRLVAAYGSLAGDALSRDSAGMTFVAQK